MSDPIFIAARRRAALDEIDDDDLRTLLRRAAARVRQLAGDADEAKVVAIGSIGSVGACIARAVGLRDNRFEKGGR